jgi:excisionase family DNA binding protein
MSTAAAKPPPPPPPGEEARWTVRDVAAFLKVSESTVLGLVRAKTLPAFRVGVQWRFDPETVRAYGRGDLPPPGAPVVPLSPSRRRRV